MATTATDGCVLDACDGTAAPRASSGAALLESRFEDFYAVVHRYLLHRLFDPELAEELAAETFCKAAVGIRRMPTDTRQMQMWLLRIATNLTNSHYRRERLRRLFLGHLANAPAATSAPACPVGSDDEHMHRRVRAAVQALPLKYQTVLVLRYYTRMSFEDIAGVLGCREPAVRARLSRATRMMRERLGIDEMPKA